MEREEIKNEIGENIILFRKQKKIKQKILAKMICIAPPYLCGIEKGRIMPSLKIIYKISEALDIEISSFFKKEITKDEKINTYNNKSLGKCIFALRREKHIMQCKLAEMIDKSSSYLCDVESGRTFPSVEVLYMIADKLDVEVWELFI